MRLNDDHDNGHLLLSLTEDIEKDIAGQYFCLGRAICRYELADGMISRTVMCVFSRLLEKEGSVESVWVVRVYECLR